MYPSLCVHISPKNLQFSNKSRYEQCGVSSHFSTGQNLLKKSWENINFDIINREKLFDRSAFVDHKDCTIPWIINFKDRKSRVFVCFSLTLRLISLSWSLSFNQFVSFTLWGREFYTVSSTRSTMELRIPPWVS